MLQQVNIPILVGKGQHCGLCTEAVKIPKGNAPYNKAGRTKVSIYFKAEADSQ